MARTSTTTSRSAGKSARSPAGKAAPRRTAGKRGKTDVLAILQDDHKRVQKLFRQFEKADREDGEAMREIADQACADLELHAALEEDIFYPALREAIDEGELEMMEEAGIEHDTARQLIAQLRGLSPGDPKYAATFTVLAEYVKHHVEEEESQIFKHAKRAKLDLEALGEQIEARRSQMQGETEVGTRAGGNGGGEKTGKVPVKEMDVEDEADMEAAAERGGRSTRSARGAR